MKHECQGAAKIWMWFLFKYRCRDRKLAFIRARLDWKVNVCVLSETTLWLWSLLGYWCVKLWIVQQTFIKELSNSYKLFNNIRICLAFLLDLIFPPAAKFVNAPLLFKIVFFLNQWMNAPSVFFVVVVVAVSAILHHISELFLTKVNRYYDQNESIRRPLLRGVILLLVAQKEPISPQQKLHFHDHSNKNLSNTCALHYLICYTQKQ